jgi:hypothetical protein
VGGPVEDASAAIAICRFAGDLVCDTPAAPAKLNLSDITSRPDCAYVGGLPGPCAGDRPYDPDMMNFMSAGFPVCRSRFTWGQLRRARATLVNLRPELIGGCEGSAARRF